MTLLKLGPDDEILHSVRLVPAGSDETSVYMRSLRPSEEDSGEAVHIPAGKRMVIKPGDLVISSDDIDTGSPRGRGGYAPVADTIWTWYRLWGAENASLLMMVLAAARRLDATHIFWSATMDLLEGSDTLAGIDDRRSALFRALAVAEVTVISLSRSVHMLGSIEKQLGLGLGIPEGVVSRRAGLRGMRNALEHIDDRAKRVARGSTADSAMSIFFQPDFVDKRVLTYAGERVGLTDDVPEVLVQCRGVIMSVIDLWPGAKLANRPARGDGNEIAPNRHVQGGIG